MRTILAGMKLYDQHVHSRRSFDLVISSVHCFGDQAIFRRENVEPDADPG